VSYGGSKKLDAKQVEEELRRRELTLRLDMPLDAAKVGRVETALRERLAHEGRPFATVRHDTEELADGGVRVSFVIDDGPKTRVNEVEFTGNQAFSDGRLRRELKRLKPPGFWSLSWLGKRGGWSADAWSGGGEDPLGDRERLRRFYLKHGYADVQLGEPKVTSFDDGSPPTRWMRMVVPVVEGARYRMGTLAFEGVTQFRDDELRPLFEVSTGEVYDESRIRRGIDAMRDLYGRRGYFQANLTARPRADPVTRVVDVTLAVEEDKLYFVGRIRFTGNETTRDKLVRRAVFLNEGDVLDTQALKSSIRSIDQLGYFKPIERAPELTLNDKTKDALDVTFPLKEQNGTKFNFGGGVSGAEGAFLNGSFGTANFLGRGETLEVTAESGTLIRDYQIAVAKPYLFDKPLSAGVEVFKRRQTYRTESDQGVQGYVDDRTGGSVSASFPLARWTRASLSYSYSVVEIAPRDVSDLPGVGSVSVPFLADVGRQRQSSLATSIVRNTVDNPLMPHRGTRLVASAPVTGGPFGGTLDFVKPRLEAVAFLPAGPRTTFGFRAESGFIVPFGETAEAQGPARANGLPFYERFFLGGELQIRGYDYRTVGPRDASGQAVGGNKYVLLNAESSLRVVGPFHLVLFYDAGQAFAEGRRLDPGRLNMSTGAELRVLLPLLNMPMRLIYAVNLNREPYHPPNAFKFAIGTTF
jgi:outer membrane protein insertion porin family